MATWYRKLDDYDVRTIREMAENGVTQREIAVRLGLSLVTINHVVKGISHAHLPVRPHRTKAYYGRKGINKVAKIQSLQSEVERLQRQLNREGNTS